MAPLYIVEAASLSAQRQEDGCCLQVRFTIFVAKVKCQSAVTLSPL